jgi:hypothetical protein
MSQAGGGTATSADGPSAPKDAHSFEDSVPPAFRAIARVRRSRCRRFSFEQTERLIVI